MYNEVDKKAFIASHTKSLRTAKLFDQVFRWFEPYEVEWGSDLSTRSTEDLQKAINEVSGVRVKSAELILTIIKEYVKWRKAAGLEVSDGVYNVKINTIEKVRQQMVASPLDLKIVLDAEGSNFDHVDKETIDIVYRVLLWMAFAGMEDSDAIKVTADEVDLTNMVIRHNGYEYEIYKECLPDFEKACNLSSFNYFHPSYTRRRQRVDGNLVLRGYRSAQIDLTTIRPILNKKFANSKSSGRCFRKLSYNRVYLSGVFYRAYEQERVGIPVDFTSVIEREMSGKEYTITSTRSLNTIANKIRREYMADYDRWKCAFT